LDGRGLFSYNDEGNHRKIKKEEQYGLVKLF
jgi:hypothetical protein